MSRSKTFRYRGQDGFHDITRAEILKTYYPWWKKQMKRIGGVRNISKEACVDDWVVVHWAWRIK